MNTKVEFEWRTEEPAEWNEPILACTEKGKLIVFKDTLGFYGGDPSNNPHSNFSWLKDKYNLKCWVYCRELVKKESRLN